MQLKSKLLFGLVITTLVLATAPAADAQINLSFFENPSSQEVQTNRNAMTADFTSVGTGLVVSGSLIADSVLTTTTLTITYPGPITSADAGTPGGAIPASDAVRIEDKSGLFGLAVLSTIKFSAGQVLIDLPSSNDQALGVNTQNGSLRLTGIRVDANSITGSSGSATYSLSTSANNYFLSESSGTVITALGPSLGTVEVGARSGQTSTGAILILANGSVPDPTGSLVINEGFASAWRSSTQMSGNGTSLANGTQIKLTFSGIPTDATLNLSSSTTSGLTVTGIANVTASSPSTTLTVTGSSLTATEQIQVNITGVAGLTIGTAVSGGAITVVADTFPQGDALSSSNTPTATGGYPRFASAPSGAVTVGNVVAASTNLLVPYAVYDQSLAFDTGITVANTNEDPYADNAGGAASGSGTIRFDFYPRTSTGAGTAWSLTTGTGATPGVGLSANGTLDSGATWSGLVSQVMASASQTGPFTGYIFITTNFLNAHSTAFVFNGSTFTSASPVLVLTPPETQARNGTTTESLGM